MYLTTEFPVCDIELAEHVAGRKRHEVEVCGIPGGQ